MAVTACSAVVLAPYLASESDTGNLPLGLILIVASTVGVAAIRTAESIHRHRTDGEPMTARLRATTILQSVGVAALIVGLADLAFLLGYTLLAGYAPLFSFPPDARHRCLVPAGVMAGGFAGLAVGYLSRRAFWSSAPNRDGMIRRLVPFAVVSLLLGANLTLRRIEYRLQQAAQHDVMASLDGGESSVPAPAPMPPGYRPRPEVAAHHVRMRRKWERAAARPWLSVDPDPPPPE
jgi:hypothetical protein